MTPAFCVATAMLASSAAAADLVGTASVRDGDTIEIRGEPIRLYGIDAPESSQLCRADGEDWRCGQRAALALADRIGRRPVTCEKRDRDQYGRDVSVCSSGGVDLNAWMVAQGWAIAYGDYSTAYVPQEEAAREAGIGIWRGECVPPWEWRRGERLASSAATDNAPGDCRIKGNLSRSGERIYHVPGGRWYSRTTINTGRGERWFCSEAEARAAGWRRAYQ